MACTSATLTWSDPASAAWPSITIGSDGLGFVSYYHAEDPTQGTLRVAHCYDAACSEASIYTLASSAGSVGKYSTVTIGADGLPLIGYYDATNGDLRAAHCADALCVAYSRRR